MAHSKTKTKPNQPQWRSPLAQQAPLVSGRWLLWSLLAIFGGGFALVYLTSCLLFWQGQWQILFHPTHPDKQVPATIGLPLEDVQFATSEAGQPRLDGWFIRATAGTKYQDETILYLHGMTTGSLPDAVPELTALHQLGINIFAFDYRGFGKSEAAHPTEKLASEDRDAAWDYLVGTRHVPAASIVFDGSGLAASLAADGALKHPEAVGVVLDDPSETALDLLRADPRSHWMPVRLLAHDRFNPAATLSVLTKPKLFLLAQGSNVRYAQQSADPKMVVYLPEGSNAEVRQQALRRFLDELPSTLPHNSN